ncbi:MAG: hypothetical protein B7X39_14120 [Lysobacterales bacterium 14-68-21]|nr:MAG: hypothetical protein B7X45_13010 [Xanthomonadales bacterium 15-68-25]OZB65382.1 MAG: hypothetical protein B7X39_14120 [Xanthomonadales bacterium 14-68-21]
MLCDFQGGFSTMIHQHLRDLREVIGSCHSKRLAVVGVHICASLDKDRDHGRIVDIDGQSQRATWSRFILCQTPLCFSERVVGLVIAPGCFDIGAMVNQYLSCFLVTFGDGRKEQQALILVYVSSGFNQGS